MMKCSSKLFAMFEIGSVLDNITKRDVWRWIDDWVNWNARFGQFGNLPSLGPDLVVSYMGAVQREHFFLRLMGTFTYFFLFYANIKFVEAVLTSTHNLCFEQKYEKYQSFLSENFQFLEVKFSLYLNRHVFVMFIFLSSGYETTQIWCN